MEASVRHSSPRARVRPGRGVTSSRWPREYAAVAHPTRPAPGSRSGCPRHELHRRRANASRWERRAPPLVACVGMGRAGWGIGKSAQEILSGIASVPAVGVDDRASSPTRTAAASTARGRPHRRVSDTYIREYKQTQTNGADVQRPSSAAAVGVQARHRTEAVLPRPRRRTPPTPGGTGRHRTPRRDRPVTGFHIQIAKVKADRYGNRKSTRRRCNFDEWNEPHSAPATRSSQRASPSRRTTGSTPSFGSCSEWRARASRFSPRNRC